ncbi:MAG: hypothetical protein IJP95_02920 [Bacteroidales bacterium]|nr:hypothetical protein [Bacteroidales bacterium]
MKKVKLFKALLLVAVALAGVAMNIACKKSEDKFLNNIRVSNIVYSNCKHHLDKVEKGAYCPDTINLSYNNGILNVTHRNLEVNCGFQYVNVRINRCNDTIRIYENGIPDNAADCMCDIDNSFQIHNLKGKCTIIIENCNPVYCQTLQL